jgi:hypothetical protein
MKDVELMVKTGGSADERCDIRVWSGTCRHDDYTKLGDKYLCSSCGEIDNLDHTISRQSFPHVSGDYDRLS